MQIWKEHEKHQRDSDTSRSAGSEIIRKLGKMKISDNKSRTAFLEEFDTNVQNYIEIMGESIADHTLTSFLEDSVKSDDKLLGQYATVQQAHIVNGSTTHLDYHQYFNHLQHFSELLDGSHPTNRIRAMLANSSDDYKDS